MEESAEDRKAPVYTLSGFNFTTNKSEIVGNGKDEEYHPYEHRDMSHSYSTMGSLAHLLKSSLGTGILAMPMAFKNSGLLIGVLGTMIITFMLTHCIQIFMQTSYDVCKRAKIPSLGYSETIEKVFEIGPPRVRKYAPFMRGITNFGMFAACAGSCCLYIIFIATSFQTLINYELNVDWDVRYYIAFTVLPCIALGEIRKLKYLVPFSAISNVCMVITFATTLWYIFDGPMDISERPIFSGWESLPLFFSTVIFAVDAIALVMPVENSMQKPQNLLRCFGVLNVAMTIVMVLYGIIGFFGYVHYGDEVKASITLNLPKELLAAKVVQILIGVAVLFTFGLKFHVPMEILWRRIAPNIPKDKHNITQIWLRAGFIVLLGVLGVAVPKLDPFIGFSGAVLVSFTGVFVPALIETAHRYPDNLGFANWILIKNILLMMVAVFAAITGSNSSIKEIIRMYE